MPHTTALPAANDDDLGPRPRRRGWLRLLLWVLVVALVAAVAWAYAQGLLLPGPSATATPAFRTPTASPTPTPALPVLTGPEPTLDPSLAGATPTALPGSSTYVLTPEPGEAGWVDSSQPQGNNLGDSHLYAGVWEKTIYLAAWRLDLSAVPRGAPIHSAWLELTGLSDRRLGTSGTWEVRMLERAADAGWSRQTFQSIHNAAVQWTLLPALGPGDLAAGRVTVLSLHPVMVRELEQRLLEEHPAVSFRIDGPLSGDNSVFAWDSGAGPATLGHPPRLFLSAGPLPATAPPTMTPRIVVVTSTPTPANVVTEAARAWTATARARTSGTATPTSIHQWTATPALVVTNTPTPASRATADYYRAVITAVALTTGTATATPAHLRTATVTPVLIPERDLTPTHTPQPAPPMPPLPPILVGQILFHSDRAGSANPWAMDASGKGVALLSAPWPYEVAASREALSPDGALLVYAGSVEGRPALLERPVEGGASRTILVRQDGQVSAPVWSPVGGKLAFVNRAPNARSQIWLVNLDGSGAAVLTPAEWGSASHPSFGPDGQTLACAVAGAGGRRQIWVLALDGSSRVNISGNLYDESDPVWVKVP